MPPAGKGSAPATFFRFFSLSVELAMG